MKKQKKNNISPLTLVEIQKRLAELEEPKAPVPKRFKINDSTVEKTHEIHSTNPRGLLMVRDEFTGLWSYLDQEVHKGDKAFYLQSWNGYGSFTYDRIGRGSISVPNLCLSQLGGTQPDKLRSYVYAAIRGGDNDGWTQRYQLIVYPDDVDWEYIDEHPNKEERDKAYAVFDALAKADFVRLGAVVDDGEEIPHFRFSVDAQKYFKAWLIELETVKLRRNDEPVLIEHLAKYRSLMPSLALIIHLVDVVNGTASETVSLEAAQKAAAWCDFLEQHARRIYALALNTRQKAALNLSEKLLEKKLADGFTARDVYVHEWRYLSTPKEVVSALNELVVKKWLREERGTKTIRYQINPGIYERGANG